ncbi:MAG: serine hydrolase [Henriciella sp.]|nr:serine hydrolase [Henriciella sp.]
MRSIFTLALLSGAMTGLSQAETLDWSEDSTRALKSALDSNTYGTATSVLILHEGQTVFEHYAHETNEETLHNTRSVTKTVTGMVLGAAIEDGAIDTATPAAAYFSDLTPFENPDPRKFEITIEDLLTMSSAMECDDWNQYSNGNEERMYLVEDWNSFFWNLPIRGFPSWRTPPEKAPYGRAFSYCTAGVQMLGEIVERAVGEPFSDYAERRVFAPLQLADFKWSRSGSGQPHLGGGLELSTRALGKLGELQRLNGMAGDDQIFSVEWAAQSISVKAEIPDTPFSYGYLWWLMPYEVDGTEYIAAAMSGNGGNRVFVLPEFGITAVFTNVDYNTPSMHQNASRFFQHEIVARLN